MLRKLALAPIACALAVLCGCGDGPAADKTIVVYSPHGKLLETDTKTRFEAAHPGWTVVFQDMGGGDIYPKIRAEKSRPRADLWWGGSLGDFKRAESEGLLDAYTPAWSASLPGNAKSPTGGWTATFVTPEIIMFNPKKIARAEVPTDWDGLLDPKWKGRIAIRDAKASSTMKLIFGALILREKNRHGSIDAGFDYLKKLHAITGYYAASPELLAQALVDEGPYALTPWTLVDALELRDSRGKPIDFVIPNETMVNIEPIALIKNGLNAEGAKLLYDFINDPQQLELMAKERGRIPARSDIPREKLPEWMRELKLNPMKIDTSEFEKHIDEWMERWDTEVKRKGGG